MKKKHEEEKENEERWLLPYSDFMTLLTIFFIVMYALSTVDSAKFKALSESLKGALGKGSTVISISDTGPGSTNNKGNITNTTNTTKTVKSDAEKAAEAAAAAEKAEQDKLQELKKQVDKYMADNGLQPVVSTEINERGLVISLRDSAFFDSGQDAVKTAYENQIITIAKILNQMGNNMRVEGYTDNVPISNNKFKSNWQLSAARATNVVELVINKAGVDANKISGGFYGETRPVADNNSEDGKAKNRRIDIVVLSSKYNSLENGK
ncbi:flagellar motor protein MotB [Clostridium sp. 19966]|uniref:flagellar motor protein MotB n=1 Tax=Clostridium sp. 19966 TaxID=2768166 RepID=UPI0028DEFFE8|nr:flagellar motor protein MotB [Clostridium sp. 19966]MDT8719502.1 flagellar motor protein MotB [Clostridium sp. 19966]